MKLDNLEIYRQIIMDHYSHPRAKGLPKAKSALTKRNKSVSCIDDITMEISFQKEKITDIHFDGVACAICTAASDILCVYLKNKTQDEALKIIDNYLAMIRNEKYDESMLNELVAFSNIHKQLNRVKCASLAAHTLKELIEKNQ